MGPPTLLPSHPPVSEAMSRLPTPVFPTTVFHYLRAVLWGLFGVRRRSGARSEVEGLSPIVLIATAFAMVGCLVLILITVASWAVAAR